MLINIDKNLEIYARAARVLINEHGTYLLEDRSNKLQELFLKEYGCEIVKTGDGIWLDLFFKTDEEASMFLLRFA